MLETGARTWRTSLTGRRCLTVKWKLSLVVRFRCFQMKSFIPKKWHVEDKPHTLEQHYEVWIISFIYCWGLKLFSWRNTACLMDMFLLPSCLCSDQADLFFSIQASPLHLHGHYRALNTSEKLMKNLHQHLQNPYASTAMYRYLLVNTSTYPESLIMDIKNYYVFKWLLNLSFCSGLMCYTWAY